MKKEQETSEEKNEEIADSTDKATAPSTTFPDRYCALLEELKTTPDLYDLLHSYCTFPESLDNLYGTSLAHLRCDCCLYAHALIRLRQRPASRWKRIKKYFASLLPAFLKKKKKA